MRFEVLSYVPIDLEAIDVDLLTVDEKEWLNNYHKAVCDKLLPYLNEEEDVVKRRLEVYRRRKRLLFCAKGNKPDSLKPSISLVHILPKWVSIYY